MLRRYGESLGIDVQHAYTDGECALRLHAVSADCLVLDNVAVLGDEPGCAIVYALRVNVVLARLDGDAVGPEGGEGHVERQAEDGVEDVEKPGGDFDEVEEHADDADVEVVVCVAASRQVSILI